MKYFILILAFIFLIDSITMITSNEVDQSYSIIGFDTTKTNATIFKCFMTVFLFWSSIKDFKKDRTTKTQ